MPAPLDIINKVVPMKRLLWQWAGIPMGEGDYTLCCPFHEDSSPSAKIFSHDNSLYCYAESKVYRSADVLKAMGVSLQSVWQELVARGLASVEMSVDDTRGLPVDTLEKIRGLFRRGEINMEQAFLLYRDGLGNE